MERIELSPFFAIPKILKFPVYVNLIEGADGSYVLVDCGQTGDYEIIKKLFVEKDVRYIIITHSHPDHIGCLKPLVEEFPEKVKFISHSSEVEFMKKGIPAESVPRGLIPNLLLKPMMWLVDNIFGEEVMIDKNLIVEPDILFDVDSIFDEKIKDELFLNYGIELIHTPGHTDGSTSVFCHSCGGDEGGEVMVGDMFCRYSFFDGYGFDVFVKDEEMLISSFEKILRMKPSKIYATHYERSVRSEELIEKFEFNRKKIYGDEM